MNPRPRSVPRLPPMGWLLGLLWLTLLATSSAAETLQPGAKIEELVVGKITYHQVVVRSYNARTLMITHTGGMASIHLHDLSPEWQERFNFSAAHEAADDEADRRAAPPPAPKHPTRPTLARLSDMDRLLQQFGQPAVLAPSVDLRASYHDLGLGVRDQGRRPSCAIFAIVSALEYQNARQNGKTESFSEDYLIWATLKTVQRVAPVVLPGEGTTDDADAGFSLTEVADALRAYGIPPMASLPADAAAGMRLAHDPSPEIIKEARAHEKVYVHQLPGRDPATRINNLVQALNAGVPVAIGMAWPNYRALRTGYLSGQKPMQNAWHAVTVVGYYSKGPRLEDTYFVFRNSWGDLWGQGGYGTVTYGYLNNYLADAVVLEIQPGQSG